MGAAYSRVLDSVCDKQQKWLIVLLNDELKRSDDRQSAGSIPLFWSLGHASSGRRAVKKNFLSLGTLMYDHDWFL